MSEPVRIAQIGAGGWGRFHLGTWKKVPNGRVIGVFDSNRAAADAAAAEAGIDRVYRTLEEAITDPEADAVTVGVPNR